MANSVIDEVVALSVQCCMKKKYPSDTLYHERRILIFNGTSSFVMAFRKRASTDFRLTACHLSQSNPFCTQTKHIDVKEAPFNGAKPPDHGLALSSPAVKLLQHLGRYSAGLRIRTHPSLQSEQIGCVPVKGIIGYTDEVSDTLIIIIIIINIRLYTIGTPYKKK